MNSCELILQLLERAGVQELFGIPGDAINHLIEAVRNTESIDFVQVRHEEAGAFAASAQAKLSGRLAVCVGTAGPGAIHLLNGLYDAKKDHAPVLAITGQVEHSLLGTSAHQEVNLTALFEDVCVFNKRIDAPERVQAIVEQAIRAAIENHGVAHINLPQNIAGKAIGGVIAEQFLPQRKAGPRPADVDLQRAVELLRKAEYPVILAGTGCTGAAEELAEVARRLGAPIVQTLRAKDVLPAEHPRSAGGIGLLGGRPAVEAMHRCDVLLMAGTDFPYLDFYPESARVIQMDRAATHIGRRVPVEVPLVCDVRAGLSLLVERLPDRDTPLPESDESLAARLWRTWMDRQEQSDAKPIKPQRLARRVGDLAPDAAIFCCDTGEVTAWCARHMPLREGQLFTLSGNLASMAYALPAAIGAQRAWPERSVIAIAGDGGLGMLLSEFLTAVKYELPITVVVFDNGQLGLIEVEQAVAGFPASETGLPSFDFAAYARLCGGEGTRVTEPELLDRALSTAFASRRPWIVDVRIDPDELLFPPRLDPSEALGFGLSKLRSFFAALSE